jgi:CTP:molybdopterin cytidylyltransferase MocA
MGLPKALATCDDAVPWVTLAIDALRQGGCTHVAVAVGAHADEVAEIVTQAGASAVLVPDWKAGMAHTLAAGLDYLAGTTHQAALIHLVDLPDVTAPVIARVLAHARADVLARATFGGRAGHPVLAGRDHWGPLAHHLAATGNPQQGARDYLRAHHTVAVDCTDLASGGDVDSNYQPCPRCGGRSHNVRR